MSTNNGQKLLVFGLGYGQHDSRKMQQVLRHYNRLPSNPGSRAALFVELTKLGKELAIDEKHQSQAQKVEEWMRTGGEFPLGITPAPINAAERRDGHIAAHQTRANGAGWPLYNRSPHGPGHHLYESQHADYNPPDLQTDDEQLGNSARIGNAVNESQQEAEADGDVTEATDADRDPSKYEEELEDDGHDADDPPIDEHQPTAASDRGAFHGRGYTLNDAEVNEVNTEHEANTPLPSPGPQLNTNRGVVVPQLRGNQQWRGNNVHGLQHHGMGMGMGMGMAAGLGLPPGMVPHGRRPRPRRPRMEHDLEDEDEDELVGQFGLGPGRTLNDPAPEQDGDLGHDLAAEPESPIDDSDHLDSQADDADPADDAADDDTEPTECPICLEEYPISGFPRRTTITDLCDHPDKACLQCLDSYISSIVETGALHILACPICPQKLTRRDVKEYANKKVYERFKYLKSQALRPGHYISCTNSTCGGSQAHDCDGPNGPKMVCNFCQAETCAKHRRPWHDGQTCVEFDLDPAQIERLEEEEATAKLLAKEATSICPKCGQGVTKTEGCDHMMCQCGTEWCYVCSCSWENILRIGATAHATFCIYHPNKVNLTKTQQDAARARIMGLVHGGEVSAELTKARDEFRQRRREEMRPKLAEAAEARMMQALEQKRQSSLSTGETPPRKKSKVKLVPAWEEGGRAKKAL